ncbi:MAG: hypothetical protein ACYDA6_03410 [Solirubrobacteraceae bacterium]
MPRPQKETHKTMNSVPTKLHRPRVSRAAFTMALASLSLASPWVATSVASNAGGADKSRPATFGDCANANAGVHNGYDCETEVIPGVEVTLS